MDKIYLSKQRQIADCPNLIPLHLSLSLKTQPTRNIGLIPLRNYCLWVIAVIIASVGIQAIHSHPERVAKQELLNSYSRPVVYGLMARHCATCR